MAPSTSCAPSLPRISLRRQSSEIRAVCASERSYGSARGATSDGRPYRDYIESTPRYQSGESFSAIKGLPPAALKAYSLLSTPSGELPALLYDPPYKHQSDAIRHSLVDGDRKSVV